MTINFGVHAGPSDTPFAARRDFDAIRLQMGCTVIVRTDPAQVETELARFAAERQVPRERAWQMAIAGTPEEVAVQLTPYVDRASTCSC